MDHGQTEGMGYVTMENGKRPAMDHSTMDGMDQCAMGRDGTQPSDQEPMDRETLDHATMDHGTMDMTPLPQGPPPASAGSGPPRAADATWGADAMSASRRDLRTETGGMQDLWFQGDGTEYRAREGGVGYLDRTSVVTGKSVSVSGELS